MFVAGAALVVAAIAVALALKTRPMPMAASTVDLSPLTQRLDRIDAAMAALGQRVDIVAAEARQAGVKAAQAVEAAAARPAESASSVPPIDLAPIEGRLAGLERTLADVARRAATIAEAERRLSEVEKMAKTERQTDAAAVAALRLGEVLASGRPYKAELALLSGMAGIEAELRTLQPRAETGIPSRAILLERFPAVAAAAARSADRGDDAWSQVVAKARSLVQVRRMTPGEDLDGRLAQAELALKSGDLGRALAATETLPEGAAQALAAWRADAKARYDAEGALERISQALAAGTARSG